MSNWEQASLDSLVKSGLIELGRGNIISKDDINNYPGPFPIYSSSAHNNGKFGEYAKYMFDEELVTWSVDGGGSFFYRPKHQFSVTNVCGFMRVKSQKLNASFIYYSLSHQHQKLTFDYTTKAHPSVIRKLYSLPKINENLQKKIALILQTTDQAIENTEALIEKYQQIKAGLMHDLFTRGIGVDGKLRPPREEAPELYKLTPIGWIPKDWNIDKLNDVSIKITDGSHQAVQTTNDGDIPFLFVSCIRNNKIIWEDAAKIEAKTYTNISKGREPQLGVILYTAVGSYGFAARVENNNPFSFQRHIAYIVANEIKINSKFLCFYLNSHSSKRYADKVAVGNAQKTVTLGALSKFPILLPTLAEQSQIADKFELIETKITSLQKQHEKLIKQKYGLMQDLLTGKVQVPIQSAEAAHV